MTGTEEVARMKIAKRKTIDLIRDFILSGYVNDSCIYIVRGWIMDELEKRNPEAFEAWIEDERSTDESLLEYFA